MTARSMRFYTINVGGGLSDVCDYDSPFIDGPYAHAEAQAMADEYNALSTDGEAVPPLPWDI
jgi:hypothetical protein